tara:strand:+ start:199 stop:615 length:417 start_codon:yes stop_codon:yes gene_type:complete
VIAQLVEQVAVNHRVAGSSPAHAVYCLQKGVFMKMLMTMLVMSLALVGCGDSDDPVAPVQEEEVMSDVVESDAEVSDSDVDSAEDVSTLDVEADDAEEEEVEEAPVEENEEDEPPMEGDPTRRGGEESKFFDPAFDLP